MLTELSRQRIIAKRAETEKRSPVIPEKKQEEKTHGKKKPIFAPDKQDEEEVAADG